MTQALSAAVCLIVLAGCGAILDLTIRAHGAQILAALRGDPGR